MKIIDIQEAQENLEQLVDDLKAGESFVVSRDGLGKVKFRALTEEEIQNWEGEVDTQWPF